MPHASRRSLGTVGDRYEFRSLGGPKKVSSGRHGGIVKGETCGIDATFMPP